MVQLQLNYEFDKKEASTKASQEMRDKRQRNQFLVGGVITLLVFSLVIVLYRNQKKQTLSNLELQQKSKSLEEENREKTSILDIVSHDLKAPLDKIKGLADIMMLEKNMSTEEKERYLAHIKQSIDQGTYLIKKLKEAQSAHDVSNKPAYEIINLSKFVEDFKFGINGQLFNKNQELKVELESANREIKTDLNMLTRILDNLVSNASKFSERGKTIHLRIGLDGKNIKVSVRDEGPGISEADRQKLFGKFQVLSSRPTAGESSTGLGLSITKALTEKLNGSIEVKSKLSSGAEFIVSIPLIKAIS
jgi:signal transduction histidine kinase